MQMMNRKGLLNFHRKQLRMAKDKRTFLYREITRDHGIMIAEIMVNEINRLSDKIKYHEFCIAMLEGEEDK